MKKTEESSAYTQKFLVLRRRMKHQMLFSKKPDSTLLQLFRYTFVGGFAFLIDIGTLYVLTEYFNIYYLVSAGIAFTLGLIVNYLLSVRWVFDSRSLNNKSLEFLLFTFIGLIGLGLNELFIWILTNLLVMYYILSKIITTFLIYFWNFFVRKQILFNTIKNN